MEAVYMWWTEKALVSTKAIIKTVVFFTLFWALMYGLAGTLTGRPGVSLSMERWQGMLMRILTWVGPVVLTTSMLWFGQHTTNKRWLFRAGWLTSKKINWWPFLILLIVDSWVLNYALDVQPSTALWIIQIIMLLVYAVALCMLTTIYTRVTEGNEDWPYVSFPACFASVVFAVKIMAILMLPYLHIA